jgi:hypothetical protein
MSGDVLLLLLLYYISDACLQKPTSATSFVNAYSQQFYWKRQKHQSYYFLILSSLYTSFHTQMRGVHWACLLLLIDLAGKHTCRLVY